MLKSVRNPLYKVPRLRRSDSELKERNLVKQVLHVVGGCRCGVMRLGVHQNELCVPAGAAETDDANLSGLMIPLAASIATAESHNAKWNAASPSCPG